MGNLKILTLATIKTIKYFPLVLLATIVGLAVFVIEEGVKNEGQKINNNAEFKIC